MVRKTNTSRSTQAHQRRFVIRHGVEKARDSLVRALPHLKEKGEQAEKMEFRGGRVSGVLSSAPQSSRRGEGRHYPQRRDELFGGALRLSLYFPSLPAAVTGAVISAGKANTGPRCTPHNQHHPGVDTALATSPLATQNALDNTSLP
ncbi:hypothetical protein O3P69_020881 [Scylla paramamosain]|uniref:Uncharacterized protein n=1 Tax=Scylla paramamosain TaxID=85552 RepID=A0AAW0TRF3_SCYPA